MNTVFATERQLPRPRFLPHAPAELLDRKLHRIGEGIGKVVYASDRWIVKRDRSPREIIALIVLWKAVRRAQQYLPGKFGRDLLARPSRQIRFLRVVVQAAMVFLPRAVWFPSHVREVWKMYHVRSVRGERLARTQLAGTPLVPARVCFPPVQVHVGGWPGKLTVSEATERVESTLHQKLADLARAGRYHELEGWLNRFLSLRQSGWQHGLFSTDAHLKNFGVTGDRIVLLDSGGLTNRWREIEERLSFEEEKVEFPHRQLGLGAILAQRPDIATRFDARWKALVNLDEVRRHWPEQV